MISLSNNVDRFAAVVLAICMLGAACNAETASGSAGWTDQPPLIDGNLEDVAWKRATPVENVIVSTGNLDVAASEVPRVRLLWDREWLYVSADMRDADIRAVSDKHDGAMGDDDAFEWLLRPSARHPGYFRFAVNAKGAVLDAFYRGAESWRDPAQVGRDQFRVDAKVTVRGTINQPGDRDDGWCLEARIPWSDFNQAGGRPASGEAWQFKLVNGGAGSLTTDESPTVGSSKSERHPIDDSLSLRFEGPEIRRADGWVNTTLVGTPEGPPKYAIERIWKNLRTASLVTVAPCPGEEWIWFVQQTPYREGATTLCRFKAKGEGSEGEELLATDEVIYNVVFHPRFAENGFVFLGTNGPLSKPPRTSRVIRYHVRDGRPDPASRTVIIEWPSDGHNGAALAFADDGLLFVSSGDGSGDSDTLRAGQDRGTLRSKILRIDVDHADAGKLYSVPADNPFLDDPTFAPETWAYGLRNPWRMTFDRVSRQLWVGENGQDLREFARLVERGANFGWSRYEGSNVFRPNEPLTRSPVTFPTIEHDHSEFRSLSGGVVYRGAMFPELEGAYIYGDWGTGRIWAAKHDGVRLEWHRELCDTPLAISHVLADSSGELLIVDYGGGDGGAVYRLQRASAPSVQTPFPKTLRETGLFSNPAMLQPAPGVLPYSIAAPSWHDGATSEYHLALPPNGTLEVRATKSWQAPDGSVLAQTLSIEGRRLETRLLVKQQNDWAGYSYVWNEQQDDAALASKGGGLLKLANGGSWRVPSRAECMMCHSRQANFALTLHDAQLNHGDQLVRWERRGLLNANPVQFARERAQIEQRPRAAAPEREQRSARASALLPANPENLARFVRADDATASVEARARSYLGVNCAHCHTLYGGGNSAMDFDWLLPLKQIAAIDREPQHGTFDLRDAKVIAPGAAGRSVIIPRVSRRGPGQMPPVGSQIADPDGVRVLAEWIESLRP